METLSKSWFEELIEKIKGWFGGSDAGIPAWNKCTLASCWNGANASQRMMNMLSPGMSDSKFDSYLNWMKDRGCNTAHLFTSNKADGENAGYSIYGPTWSWAVNPSFVGIMKSRIEKLNKKGFGIVLWLFADDSSGYAAEGKKNFPKYLQDLKDQGLLKYASTVVVGLELEEYFNANDVARLVNATRAVYSGKIGTHHGSGKTSFAALADLLFYQVKPGMSAAAIAAETKSVMAKTGKPVNMFELERGPDRAKAQAALNAGAFGVGNW